jgi:hypothetical protein
MVAVILQKSRVEASNAANKVAFACINNTKDDISHLIHLYKNPGPQMHWTIYYGVLSRTQLDEEQRKLK